MTTFKTIGIHFSEEQYRRLVLTSSAQGVTISQYLNRKLSDALPGLQRTKRQKKPFGQDVTIHVPTDIYDALTKIKNHTGMPLGKLVMEATDGDLRHE